MDNKRRLVSKLDEHLSAALATVGELQREDMDRSKYDLNFMDTVLCECIYYRLEDIKAKLREEGEQR